MKRVITIMAAILIAVTAMQARSRHIATSQLPAPVTTFIEKNFGKNKIHHAKLDGSDYDIVLRDGTELEFDRNGKLTDIDCGNKGVPTKLLPTPIADYVKRYCAGQKVSEMEVRRNGYKIELTNGQDIIFDSAGNFVKYDR